MKVFLLTFQYKPKLLGKIARYTNGQIIKISDLQVIKLSIILRLAIKIILVNVTKLLLNNFNLPCPIRISKRTRRIINRMIKPYYLSK
jgi:hypothetical protein